MRRTTLTTALVGTLAASVALAPAAYAAVEYNVPAPGDRTCFTATSNGDGTTSVTEYDPEDVDFEDDNPNYNLPASGVNLGAKTVVVGTTPKRLTATVDLTQTCGGIRNVQALILVSDTDVAFAFVEPFDFDNPRNSGTTAPSQGDSNDGTWSLPYDIYPGTGGTFELVGLGGLLNWKSAVLDDATGTVVSSVPDDDFGWFSDGRTGATIKVLRQTRGTVSGPSSVKANTTFLLRVQTQQADDSAWAKLPYATVKIDYNTGSGWKYLKTVKTTSTGIYNTKVRLAKTTQYRYRYYGSPTTASFTSKTFTVKRS